MNLFRTEYIKIGDRALPVLSSTGGADFDRSYVDLQLEYYDDRSDEADTAPFMGCITTPYVLLEIYILLVLCYDQILIYKLNLHTNRV